jgi:membrane fusion protein (multidrug efflux system)
MKSLSLPLQALAAAIACVVVLPPALAQTASRPALEPIDAPALTPAPAAASAPPRAAAEAATVRALIVAEMEATISSQFAGRLTAMPRQVGETFAAGDLLASFDCQERHANVGGAQAELLGARETHLAKLKLQGLGAVSDLDVTLAASAAEKARSQLALAQAQERQCVVRAPYAGKVVRMRAKAFESVQLGQPLLEIVNLSSIRAQLLVPSSWVRWLKPGRAFTLAVDETGGSYMARVHRISGRIDGSSQTVEVIGRFEQVPADVLPGMIGRANFQETR